MQEGGGVISTQMPFIQQHVVYTDTNPRWHGVSLGLGEGQDHMMAYNHCALSLTTTMMSPLNYTPLTSWNEERVQIPTGTPISHLKNYFKTLQFAFLLR